jgi:tetratricopeptide (TPR) repeat protein
VREAARREELLSLAELALQRAQYQNPLDVRQVAALGEIYTLWALAQTNLTQREAFLEKATRQYQAASVLYPAYAPLWVDWALLDLRVGTDLQSAFQKLQHALSLDDTYARTYAMLGDYYAEKASQATNESAHTQDLQAAAQAYQAAIEREGAQDYYLEPLANVYAQLGQSAQALQAYQQAAQSSTPQTRYRILEAIALFYLQQGNKEQALSYARQAYAQAPPSERIRLESLLNELNP